MLKNNKIVVFLIVLTISGTISILGIWLADNYKNIKEITLSKCDQALINTLYAYYNDKELLPKNQPSPYQTRIASDIHSKYPTVNVDSIYEILEQNATQRREAFSRRLKQRGDTPQSPAQRNNRNREINPWIFASYDTNLENSELDSIQQAFSKELAYYDLEKLTPTLKMEVIDVSYPKKLHKQTFITRPILLHPEKHIFLYAEFKYAQNYLLKAMMGQVLFALILISALIGTFITLIKTINKQQKLALLQKTFVNNMTHELKTPLSTIGAALEAIQRFGARNDVDKMNKYLDLSRNEVDHLSQIVENVLQFNVSEQKALVISPSPFDLVELCQQVAERFRLSHGEKLDISIHTSAPSIIISADKGHFRNVINNLIDNGIKYNTSEKIVIQLDITDANKKTSISITDNGVGIPKTYLSEIFNLFFRVPHGNIYTVKGFGIGLSYVKQIVSLHRGDVSVQSEEGVGSTFTLTISQA